MQNRIEKGDRVKVTFAGNGYFTDIEGVVDCTPGATGESCILVEDDGRVIYVQQFETMILLSKPNKENTRKENYERRKIHSATVCDE